MSNTILIEKAKSYLTNSSTARKIIFEEKYRENKKEPKYPKRFWEINVFYYKYDLNNIKQPNKNDWTFSDTFYTKNIEKAIAHSILHTRSNEIFEEISQSKILPYWLRRKIEYVETVRSKKDRIRYKSYFNTYDILNSGKEVESYEASFGFRDYTLINIPIIMTKLSEELPFGFLTYEVEEQDPIYRYPYFLYESNLYKSTYYIHNQKCICGDAIGHGKHNDGLKVEIWYVDKFMEENIIYIFNGFIYFNGNATPYTNSTKEELKKLYPNAKGCRTGFEYSNFEY